MDVHFIWTFRFSGHVHVTVNYLSFCRSVSNHARVFIVNQSLIEWIYRNCIVADIQVARFDHWSAINMETRSISDTNLADDSTIFFKQDMYVYGIVL